MGYIKQIVRRSAFASIVRRYRAKRAIRQWTGQDEKMSEFYSQFVSKGDLVFDVGANVGNRVKIFLRLGADVIAVEPQPDCIETLKLLPVQSEQELTILDCVLGAEEGSSEIRLSSASTISSMSDEWIDAVKASGRFEGYDWERSIPVKMKAIDQLIATYGAPAFVKIDVEGFELEVLKGLTNAIRALSYEFTPELIDVSVQCVDQLELIANFEYNMSIGETMAMEFEQYVSPEKICEVLKSFEKDTRVFGDIYCRLK